MLRVSRVAVSTAVGVLLISACGGSPMYAERDVDRVSAPASPASPTSPATASTSKAPTATHASRSIASSKSSKTSSSTTESSPSRSASSTPASPTPSTTPSTTTSTPSPSSPSPSTTSPTPPPTTATSEAPTSSSEPETSSPTPTTSTPAAEPTTLNTLGGPGSGPISIAGQSYPNSFSVSACTVFSTQPSYDFDLEGRYARLTGVVGQDDGSTSKQAHLRLTVLGDGRTLTQQTVHYGQRVPLSVDVSGVSTLTLDFSEVECGSDGAALAVGHPRVS